MADTVGVINNGRLIKEVSMQSIKESSTEFIELSVNEGKKAAFVLSNNLKISNFKILDKNIIRVYEDDVPQSRITKTLITNVVTIEAISKKNSSLEDYFLNLLNGGGINA
jgi:ABC-2 type transport system ATP-binding protein